MADGRPVMDKCFKHRHGKPTGEAFCAWARAIVNDFSGYVQFCVGVGAKASRCLLKFDLKLRTSAGATHWAFHAKLKRHLLKYWAVLVLAVIHSMH